MAPPPKEALSLKLYLRYFKPYFNLPLMLSLKLSSSNCLNLDLNTHPLFGLLLVQKIQTRGSCEMLQVVSVVSWRGLGSREWTEE